MISFKPWWKPNKNILVCKNYTVTDHTKWYNDRTTENNMVNNYDQMEKICLASAEKNLVGLDDIVVFRGEADNIRDVFKQNFYEIHDLWAQGNNILYADLDVVFLNQWQCFEPTYLFSMYNLTDPTNTEDRFYNVKFPFYFNCGIRYYPYKMMQSVWDIGFEMFENFNPDRWDAEQIIYNAMMWSQSPHIGDFYRNRNAYQMLQSPMTSGGQSLNRQFNGELDIKDAFAVHIHGSRGSGERLEIMNNLYNGSMPEVEETLFL